MKSVANVIDCEKGEESGFIATSLIVIITVADEQQDEGLVLYQVDNGPLVGVVFQR